MSPGPEGPTVEENVTRGHYDRLAATYDENWAHTTGFVAWMTSFIRQRLRIADGDLVADIGCGTGLYARARAARCRGRVRRAVAGVAGAGPGGGAVDPGRGERRRSGSGTGRLAACRLRRDSAEGGAAPRRRPGCGDRRAGPAAAAWRPDARGPDGPQPLHVTAVVLRRRAAGSRRG